MRVRPLTWELKRHLTGERTPPRDDDVHLQSSVEWLYRSQDATSNDGCAATYNLLLGWERAYPETTGYIVPTLYDYATYTDTDEPRGRAQAMARWLLDVQLESGAFPAGTLGGRSEPSVFNTGQVLFGLARARTETGDDAFLRALTTASRWLVDVQEPAGYWSSYTYQNSIHAYTARVGWALAVASELTGDEHVRRAAARNLSWVQRIQRENGSFEYCAFEPSDDPVLHTLAYTVRGLVEGGRCLEDSDAFEAGKRAADRLLSCQQRDGSLAGAYDETWNGAGFACITGMAQMAVVWIRLAELTGQSRYVGAARRAIEYLKHTHRLDAPEPIRGAHAGSRPIWGPYMRLRYPNWASKFFVDALLARNSYDSPSTESVSKRIREQ